VFEGGEIHTAILTRVAKCLTLSFLDLVKIVGLG
jgi:hypothetical protein